MQIRVFKNKDVNYNTCEKAALELDSILFVFYTLTVFLSKEQNVLYKQFQFLKKSVQFCFIEK